MKYLAPLLIVAASLAGTAWAQTAPAPVTPPVPVPAVPAPAAVPPAAPAPAARPRVTIVTAKGNIVIELRPDEAPRAAANFEKLVKDGFYNGLTFHRVVPGFVVQGGDPKGDGTGGPGYTIPNETNHALTHEVGAVAMANAGPNTAGSQFYIVITKPAHFLDVKDNGVSRYTIFGQVVSGQDVAEKIAVGDKMTAVTRDETTTPAKSAAPAPPAPKVSRPAAPRLTVPFAVPFLENPHPPKNPAPTVHVSVGADGKVTSISLKPNTGESLLDQAVKDNVMQWTWEPALKNGVPVKSVRTFVYDLLTGSRLYK